MYAFIALVVASLVLHSRAQLLPLPGCDFLGFGFNARYMEPQQAMVSPLFEWSYNKSNQYKYPVADTTFKYPDQVFVRTVASTRATSNVYSSMIQYQSQKASEYGTYMAGFRSSDSAEQASKTDVSSVESVRAHESLSLWWLKADITVKDTTVNTQETNTSNTNSYSRMFSDSADYKTVQQVMASNSAYYVENAEITQLYHAMVDFRSTARDDFVYKLALLKGQSYWDNQASYMSFLDKYGTHFVSSVVIGGAIFMTSTVDKEAYQTSYNTSASIGANVTTNGSSNGTSNVTSGSSTTTNLGITSNFGLNVDVDVKKVVVTPTMAMASTSKTFSQTLTSKVDFQTENAFSSYSISSDQTYQLIGGDFSLVDLLTQSTSGETYSLWKTTIAGNPVPVYYQLKTMGEFYTDDILAGAQMEIAINDYLTNYTFVADIVKGTGF